MTIQATDLPEGLTLCESCGTPIPADRDREVCNSSNGVEFCPDGQCHLAFHAVTRTLCAEAGR